MLGTNMLVSLIFQAVNKTSSVFGQINGGFKKLDDSVKSVSKRFEHLTNIGKKLAGIGAGLSVAGGGLAYSLGLTDALSQSLDAEHALRSLGNVGELTKGQIADIDRNIRKISVDTNQYTKDLIEGINTLVASGLKPQIAVEFMPTIGKTATGEIANVNELAKTGYAMYDTLKVPVHQLKQAMDIVTQSGKEGRFELKDMANYFPMLTAGAQSLGMQGTRAVSQLGAALQVAMKGAADPEEAARNFQNFIMKITSKDTVKNFANFGVDVETELNKAIKSGIDPIEHMVGLLQKVTGGNKFKLAEIFADMQVTNFLVPMMNNMEEYQRIRDKTFHSKGVVDKDFQSMMGTSKEQIKQLKINLSALVMPTVNRFFGLLNAVLTRLNGSSSGLKIVLGSVIGLLVGGLFLSGLGLMFISISQGVTAVKYLTLALSPLKSIIRSVTGQTLQFINVQRLMNYIQYHGGFWRAMQYQLLVTKLKILENMGALKAWTLAQAGVFRANFLTIAGLKNMSLLLGGRLLGGLKTAIAGVRALSLAFLTSPVGWIAVGIAAAALLIYKYWNPLKAFFGGIWTGIKEGFAPLLEVCRPLASVFAPVISVFKAIFGWVARILKPVQDTKNGFQGMANAGKVVGQILALAFTWPVYVIAGLPRAIMWVGRTIGSAAGWIVKNWRTVLQIMGWVNPITMPIMALNKLVKFVTGLNLFQAGAKIISSLWQGMMSMISKPVEAVRGLVQKMRNFLPFSPAKEGPFRDLNKVRIIETIAETIKPGSLINSMQQAMGKAREAMHPISINPLQADTNKLKTAIAPLTQPIKQVLEPVKTLAAPLMQPVMQKLHAVKTSVAPVTQPIFQKLEKAASTPLTQPVMQKLNAVKTAIAPLTQPIKQVLEPVKTLAAPLMQPVMQKLQPQSTGNTKTASLPGKTAGSVTINYSPTINLSGEIATAKDDFIALLKQHKDEILRLIESAKVKEARVAY